MLIGWKLILLMFFCYFSLLNGGYDIIIDDIVVEKLKENCCLVEIIVWGIFIK